MKTKKLLALLFIGFFMVSIMAFGSEKPENTKTNKMPDNIKAVIEKSCFGCHNTASKNTDAKEELDFKKLEGLSTIKKISAYKGIAETVEEESMPPKKFLAKFPDKKLTDEEKKMLIDWANKEAKALVKGM